MRGRTGSAGNWTTKTTTTKGKRKMKEIKVTSMTEAEIRSATAALVELRRQMTFVLPMTGAERQANRKLGRKTVQVTQMRAAAAREHKDSLPPSFDLRAFERQVAHQPDHSFTHVTRND
jgi:hypothetical protein